MNERRKTRLGIFAVGLLFFLNGGISQAIPPRYAEISAKLGLDPGQLGLALVGGVIGLGIPATMFAFGFGERFSSRLSYGVPLILFCLSPVLVAFAGSGLGLFGSQLYQGFFNAPVDLAQNTLGLMLSVRAGRTLLPRFEAGFSVGALAGAGAGALAAGRVALAPYLFGVALVAVALGLLAACFLPSSGKPAEEGRSGTDPRSDRRMWAIAILAFFALLAEFVGQDWASVFYRSELHAAPTQYGLGGVAFQGGFIFVLLLGGRLADRFGPVLVIRWSAVVFTAAMTVYLLSGSVLVATVALGLAGVGAGNLVPLAIGGVEGHSRLKTWMGRVTAVMYLGPGASRLVGLLANVISLRWALLVCAIPVGIAVFALAPALRSPRERSLPEAAEE